MIGFWCGNWALWRGERRSGEPRGDAKERKEWKDVAERQLDAKCRSLSSLVRRGISQDERSLKEWQLILVRELVARVIQAFQKVNEPSNSHSHVGTRSDMP